MISSSIPSSAAQGSSMASIGNAPAYFCCSCNVSDQDSVCGSRYGSASVWNRTCSSSFCFLKDLNEASVADYAGKDCLTPTTCTDVGASLALLRRLMITEILYLLRQRFLLILSLRSTDLFDGAGTGARGLHLSAVLIWARATTSTGMPRRHTPSPRLAISAAAGQRWWRACQFSAPSLRRLEFFLTISPASVRRAQHLRISQV